MLRIELYEILRDDARTLDFLQNVGLIPTTITCVKCNQIKPITSLKNERCNLRFLEDKCYGEGSIFKNTIFEKCKIEPKIIIYFLYEWCENTPVFRTAKQYSCSESCVSKWAKKFQKFAVWAHYIFENHPIGGENVVVQIDETQIVKKKSNQD